MAISEGIHASDEKKEVEHALLHDSDTMVKQETNDIILRRHNKKLKLKACVPVGILVLVIIAVAVVCGIVLGSAETDKDMNCFTNIRIPNGRLINATGSRQGDIANIECEDGHALNGSDKISCLSSGHWNDTPVCLSIQCNKIPLPKHAKIELRHMIAELDEKITVTCDDGFILKGNKIVICHNNETWSKLPTCQPVNCGVPSNIENGIVLNLTQTTYNETFHVNCNSGYLLRGTRVIKCGPDGTWGELPKCERVSCGTPVIPKNANIKDLEGHVYNKYVTFKCSKDFILIGNSSSTCQSNGEWSKYPECKRTCPLDFNISNGYVINKAGLRRAHLANIECEDGYKLNGSKTIVCLLSGQWSETPFCVRKQCKELQPPQHSEIKPRSIDGYVTEVMIWCNTGFHLEGSSIAVCQDNETWSPIPACRPVDCGQPSDINNGIVSNLYGTLYTNTFKIKCNTGYQLKGDRVIRCESDGKWSGRSKCDPVSCGSPMLPDNAHIQDINGEVFGSRVIFLCNRGYRSTAISATTCQSNGNWSRYPRCERIKANENNEHASGCHSLQNNLCAAQIIYLFVIAITRGVFADT